MLNGELFDTTIGKFHQNVNRDSVYTTPLVESDQL